uniref:Uncharacterized protein n=1 Tax=Pectinophora gossypiella TaxID=13191 RepID=A0A1E1WPF8_PECGO
MKVLLARLLHTSRHSESSDVSKWSDIQLFSTMFQALRSLRVRYRLALLYITSYWCRIGGAVGRAPSRQYKELGSRRSRRRAVVVVLRIAHGLGSVVRDGACAGAHGVHGDGECYGQEHQQEAAAG